MTIVVWVDAKFSNRQLVELVMARADFYQPFGAEVFVNDIFRHVENLDDFYKGSGLQEKCAKSTLTISPRYDAELALKIPVNAILAGFNASLQKSALEQCLPRAAKHFAPQVMDIGSVGLYAMAHGMKYNEKPAHPFRALDEVRAAMLVGKEASDFFLTKVVH